MVIYPALISPSSAGCVLLRRFSNFTCLFAEKSLFPSANWDICSNVIRVNVNNVILNCNRVGNESTVQVNAFPYALSPSRKNSRTGKVSATSWHSGLTAREGGRRRWWPRPTPPPISTGTRPFPLSPRSRCGWECITTKETGRSAGWSPCSLRREVRDSRQEFIAVLRNFNNMELNRMKAISQTLKNITQQLIRGFERMYCLVLWLFLR